VILAFFFENCEALQKKVHYILKTMDKFSKGQSNLKAVLSSQNCVLRKVGLGFNPNSKNKSVSKPFSSFFKKKRFCRGVILLDFAE